MKLSQFILDGWSLKVGNILSDDDIERLSIAKRGLAGTDTAARIDLAIVAFQEGDISRETLTREVIAALTDGIRSEL